MADMAGYALPGWYTTKPYLTVAVACLCFGLAKEGDPHTTNKQLQWQLPKLPKQNLQFTAA